MLSPARLSPFRLYNASKNVKWTTTNNDDSITLEDENEWNYFDDDCIPQVWVDYFPTYDTLTELGVDAISGTAVTYHDSTG